MTLREIGYPTPAGLVDGVKLVGMAIESLLQKRVLSEPPEAIMIASDIACGIAFAIAGHLLPARFVLLLILSTPVFGAIFSYFTFARTSCGSLLCR
ncbi:MAG: hypothetical protein IPL73_23600 [Candidatus Obscuribacter sp.]|nr:hypothetical protein [Candidatus Obscuribacter sp.]